MQIQKRFAPELAKRIPALVADRRLPGLEVAAELDQLSHKQRANVLGALCPTLGAALSTWWEWSRSAPYQSGWSRRAYRSSDPRHSQGARWETLVGLLVHGTWYPQPLSWHASWLLYLDSHPLGGVLAAAIDAGDREIKRILMDSVQGRHPISGPSQEAYVALLSSNEPDCWDVVEKLLVGTERSEGLRQTILEAADLGRPDAFARILAVVSEHNLTRFAGTVRAAGVWVGEEVDVRQGRALADAVDTMRRLLAAPPTTDELLAAEPLTTYLGLWALAVRDAPATIDIAGHILHSPHAGQRLAAARLLTDIALPEAATHLASALEDASLPVYAAAIAAWPVSMSGKETSQELSPRVGAELERRVGSVGREQVVETGLLGARPVKVSAGLAADVLVAYSPNQEVDRCIAEAATTDGRYIAVRRYAGDPQRNREALFAFLTDRSSQVRGLAANALEGLAEITREEALQLEKALTRRSADLRTIALSLLQKQRRSALNASVQRLSEGTADQQRAADELQALLRGPEQEEAVDQLPPAVWFTSEDRTPARRPSAPPKQVWEQYHRGIALAWRSLGAWLDEHADTEVQTYFGVELLANIRWLPDPGDASLPLPDVVGPWWERTRDQLTDGGVELALLSHMGTGNKRWVRQVNTSVLGPLGDWDRPDNPNRLRVPLIAGVARHAWRDSWTEPVLDMLETAAAALPLDALMGPPEVMARRGRRITRDQWGSIIGTDDRAVTFDRLFSGSPSCLDPSSLSDAQLRRLWQVMRFIDEPEGTFDRWSGPMVEVSVTQMYGQVQDSRILAPDQPERLWPEPRMVMEAYERGFATRADLVDSLVLQPRVDFYLQAPYRDALWAATALKPAAWAARAKTRAVVADVREAVIAHETSRGDLPTVLSSTAKALRSAYGAASLIGVLAALGKRPFVRGYAWTESRESALSHLVRIHQPSPDDTAARLGRLAKDAKISEARLVETAVYAPQWAGLIEAHLDWPGLESAVWWVHAHTKDDSWSVDAEIRNQWASQVSQRTPLDSTDLVRGGADVAWFHDMLAELGPERFEKVLKAAKYASSSAGHKRAELFASALLDEVLEEALLERIRDKRHQDSVRALGLLPLPEQGNADVLLRRYELLRGFVASDRTSGSQRRT